MSRTAEAIRINFDFPIEELSHGAWLEGGLFEITRYWSGEPAPPARHAEGRVVWTANALYLRFICRQYEPLITSVAPNVNQKTIGLWDRDVCEAFLAPNPHKADDYYEFEVAPSSEWLDLAIHHEAGRRVTDWEFHSGMTAAALVNESQVILGMRVPWSDRIFKPRRGDQWRANFFRCVGSQDERGYLAWEPTATEKPNFHVPEAFGWLGFK